MELTKIALAVAVVALILSASSIAYLVPQLTTISEEVSSLREHVDTLSYVVAPPELELAAKAKEEGVVTIYTALSPVSSEQWIAKFNEVYPWLKVEYIRLVSLQLRERIKTELQGGMVEMDLYHEAWIPGVADAAYGYEANDLDKGYIEYWVPPEAEAYKEYYEEAAAAGQGLWGYCWPVPPAIPWVFAWNRDYISDEEAPTSWHDFADPKWKGLLGITNPITHSTASMTYYRMAYYQGGLPGFGEDFLRAVAANEPMVYTSATTATSYVASGECPLLMITNQGLCMTQWIPGAPISWRFPKEGGRMATYALAMFKGCKHPNAAKFLMNWLLSKEGQMAFSEATGRAAVRPDVPHPYEGKCPYLLDLPAIEPEHLWWETMEFHEDYTAHLDEYNAKMREIFGL